MFGNGRRGYLSDVENAITASVGSLVTELTGDAAAVELAIVLEERGRASDPTPYLAMMSQFASLAPEFADPALVGTAVYDGVDAVLDAAASLLSFGTEGAENPLGETGGTPPRPRRLAHCKGPADHAGQCERRPNAGAPGCARSASVRRPAGE